MSLCSRILTKYLSYYLTKISYLNDSHVDTILYHTFALTRQTLPRVSLELVWLVRVSCVRTRLTTVIVTQKLHVHLIGKRIILVVLSYEKETIHYHLMTK